MTEYRFVYSVDTASQLAPSVDLLYNSPFKCRHDISAPDAFPSEDRKPFLRREFCAFVCVIYAVLFVSVCGSTPAAFLPFPEIKVQRQRSVVLWNVQTTCCTEFNIHVVGSDTT